MPFSLKTSRNYLALVLLFIPALAFAGSLITTDWGRLGVSARFPFLPWQFWLMAAAGTLATYGGVSDWRYHRNPLNLQLSSRERDAEASDRGLDVDDGCLPALDAGEEVT